MKKFFLSFLALSGLLVGPAFSQTVSGNLTLTWVLPPLNTDGSAIPSTGPVSLAKVEVWVSSATIPDTVVTTAPTATITPAGTTTTQTVTVPLNGKAYARLRVCNVAGVCGALATEVNGSPTIPTPGVPTNVTIVIKVQ